MFSEYSVGFEAIGALRMKSNGKIGFCSIPTKKLKLTLINIERLIFYFMCVLNFSLLSFKKYRVGIPG